MKIPARRHRGRSGFFIINFELFRSFLSFPIVDFEQVNILLRKLSDILFFDICFNVSTIGRQDLTRGNVQAFDYSNN